VTARDLNGDLHAAYAICRRIAKREAKNFYYAFRVLPEAKSDAMCAIYAFMRRADDISDDESVSIPERREIMASWLDAWRRSAVEPSLDAVFVAVRDTQRRFQISDELLEQLVRGTTMDLEESLPGVVTMARPATGPGEPRTLQIYDRFEDLYRYCYLVASVVGLVCIRIFGYRDARAEVLAEKTGLAFQLTNILRDVKEDAERGRIYLPLEDLARTKIEVEQVVRTAEGRLEPKTVKALLALEGGRASEFYRAAEELIPLLDRDSQAAMWVLVTIYRGLLERIEAKGFDVFTERVSVPTSGKLLILARGVGKTVLHRVMG
jgi:15-cis-phytoene synthase